MEGKIQTGTYASISLPTLLIFRSYDHFAKAIAGGIHKLRNPFQCSFNFSRATEYVKLFGFLNHFTNCTILIDEADALFSHQEFKKVLVDLFLGSRNKANTLIFATKRPFLLPILVRSQADEIIIFRTEEVQDIRYITTRVRTELPQDPATLGIGQFIIWKTGQKPVLENFKLKEQPK